MGSSASKTARAATGTATRKYPTRPSPSTHAPSTQSPLVQISPPRQQENFKGNAATTLETSTSDSQYNTNLRNLGAVDPNTTFSHYSDAPRTSIPSSPTAHSPDFYAPPTRNPSSHQPFRDAYSLNPASNPALLILQARQQLQDKADKELDTVGRSGFQGREFVDVHILREALLLRRMGLEEGVIEERLELKTGVVRRLGGDGVVDVP